MAYVIFFFNYSVNLWYHADCSADCVPVAESLLYLEGQQLSLKTFQPNLDRITDLIKFGLFK